jgi:hypothetical protein
VTAGEREHIRKALLRIYSWCSEGELSWAVRADQAELTDPNTAGWMRKISKRYGQMSERLMYFEREALTGLPNDTEAS